MTQTRAEGYAEALIEMISEEVDGHQDSLIYVFDSVEQACNGTSVWHYKLRFEPLDTPIRRGKRYEILCNLLEEWEQGFRVGTASILWNTDRHNHGTLTIKFDKEA